MRSVRRLALDNPMSQKTSGVIIVCRWIVVMVFFIGIIGASGLVPLISPAGLPAWVLLPLGVCIVFAGIVEIIDGILLIRNWMRTNNSSKL